MRLFITDDLLKADRNNLTLVRLILASAVIYTHALVVNGQVDETTALFGREVSWMAVNGFFSLSGFLMYRSLERNSSLGHFALSRFLRIWPGMFAMCVIVAAAFAVFTTLPISGYFTHPATLSFVTGAQLLSPTYNLPGIYCHEIGGGPCVINGPLWTIRWEVSCYVAIALVSLAGMLTRRRFTLIVFPAILLYTLIFLYPPVHDLLESKLGSHLYFLALVARLWMAFALGSVAYANRSSIPLSWPIALFLLALVYITQNQFFGDVVRSIAVCYWVLCIGFLTVGASLSLHKIPDYSFGVYIYGMPVMNVFRILAPNIESHLLAVITFLATLPAAAFSWHFIEKPAQEFRKTLRWPRVRVR